MNYGFELNSNEDTPDQRRLFGFERLTGWFPEPTPKEPEDFLDQLVADEVSGQPNMFCIPQPPMEPPTEPLNHQLNHFSNRKWSRK